MYSMQGTARQQLNANMKVDHIKKEVANGNKNMYTMQGLIQDFLKGVAGAKYLSDRRLQNKAACIHDYNIF